MNYTCVRSGYNKIYVRQSDKQNFIVKSDHFAPKIYQRFIDKNRICAKTIQGEFLEEVTGIDSIEDARNYLDTHKDLTFLYAQPNIAYEYIREKYYINPAMAPVTKADVYGLNWDIETARDDQGYSSVDDARCEITAISIKDSRKDFYQAWSTKEFNIQRAIEIAKLIGEEFDPKKLKYNLCRNEKELIVNFVFFWSEEHPDYITGWNIDAYDIPYLINRIKVLWNQYDDTTGEMLIDDAGDKIVAKLSPFGQVKEVHHNTGFGKKYNSYDIIGVNNLDLFLLYKKFTYGGHDSYTLNQIGYDELKTKKISYTDEGTLFDLFNNNFEKFILYNMKDVKIVEGLDDKLNLVNLVMSLAYKTGANWPDMLSPVRTWDVLIYNTLADDHIIIPWSVTPPDRASYIGAYVKDPIPKMYQWVASFDLNSLYPHLQMGHNLSPDRFIQPHLLPQEIQDYIRSMPQDTTERVKWMLDGNFKNSLFKKYNIAFTPNGHCWSRVSDGFIPKILNGIYTERSTRKKEMKVLEQKVEDLKKQLT
jgi:DNA polymerase elongation subunit (family B)